MKPVCLVAAFLFLIPMVANSDTRKDSPTMQQARWKMVSHQIRDRGISDERVIGAMGKVPRHLFVPEKISTRAYGDHPLPIGEGQTISQPYIVALMTASLGLKKTQRVLEIGTGSGYQAAILAEIVREVYTIEIKEKLYHAAKNVLKELDYAHVHMRQADGYFGWEKAAPFDAIMITAAVDHIPPPLLGQLKNGGQLIVPLGNPFSYQNLVQITKHGSNYTVRQITGVLFVPMTGFAISGKDDRP